MYQVGFGDCFLLSFHYEGDKKRHVLIDFGSSKLPGDLKQTTYMPRVAEDIQAVCGGRLDAVVATHRHSDHISGFATDGSCGDAGKIIAGCHPKVVVQPWTEDPNAATNATRATRTSNRSKKGFVAGLASMNRIAGKIVAMTAYPPASMSATTVRNLRFIGETNVKNLSAVENLIGMGKAATAVWANAGSRSGLEGVLPGVKVRVLGPPDLTQSEAIRRMRSSDPDEFWPLVAGSSRVSGGGVVPPAGRSTGKPGRSVPPEARWFRNQLERVSGEQLLEIVTALDSQMNNTSLVLLFEVGKKKLLFPGDAQLENWGYALGDAPDADATRSLLADLDVYKVGHHGSRNATPKELFWEGLKKLEAPGGDLLVSLLSTLSNKHPGVPRPSLVDALKRKTDLHDTRELPKGKEMQLFDLITIPV
jgi:hypothetical protein